jgi:peroxiredoxin
MRRPAALALLVLALFAAGCEREKKAEAPKAEDLDFALKDVGGREVRLSDYRGKVVLLEFFATWCPPCRMAVPEMNELHRRLSGKDAVVIAVSVGERMEDVREFVSGQGITYTVLVDNEGIDSRFGVSTIPSTFILDKNGAVVARHMGFMPGFADEMAREIEKHL